MQIALTFALCNLSQVLPDTSLHVSKSKPIHKKKTHQTYRIVRSSLRDIGHVIMGILPSTHHAPLIALDSSVFSKSVKFRPKAGQVEHKLGLGADDSVLITFSACDAIRHAANTTNHEPAINLHKRSIDDLHTSWELQENGEWSWNAACAWVLGL